MKNLTYLWLVLALVIGLVLGVGGARLGAQTATGGALAAIANERGLSGAEAEAALATFVAPGEHDDYLMFASGGHSGQLHVVGIPSLQLLKTIPVFTPDAWSGYGFGADWSMEILEQAVGAVETEVDLDDAYGLVLAKDGWHPGVIGIVASRLVERFGRPTILVALEGDEGRGSGRSIPGFDLHAALVSCAPHLARFGGHTMAAGLTVRRERLDDFRLAFNAAARGALEPDDLIPTQRIDLLVSLDHLDLRLERMLQALEPCGPGNPAPVFGAAGARARDPRVVGTNHLRFTLDDGTSRLPAIGFDWADRVDQGWAAGPVDVAFRLDRDEWQGDATLQARVVHIRPAT